MFEVVDAEFVGCDAIVGFSIYCFITTIHHQFFILVANFISGIFVDLNFSLFPEEAIIFSEMTLYAGRFLSHLVLYLRWIGALLSLLSCLLCQHSYLFFFICCLVVFYTDLSKIPLGSLETTEVLHHLLFVFL